MSSQKHERLCSLCSLNLNIPLKHNIESGGPYHRNYALLSEAADSQCYVCHRVQAEVVRIAQSNEQPLEVRNSRYSITPNGDKRILDVDVELRVGKMAARVEFIIFEQARYPSVKVQDRVSSSTGWVESLKLAVSWLEQCRQTHECCRKIEVLPEDRSLPTRLIDVGSTAGLEQRVRLCYSENLPENAEYLSLSHAWGGKKFVTLTSQNHDAFLENIPPETLSQAFQDALEVSRILNIRYIWIDSLCIVQDDAKDWEFEAKRMADVYKNAVCNLSASAFESGVDGFLPPARSSDSTLPGVHVDGFKPQSVWRIADSAPWRSIWHAPLFRRAWVLQEQILAPRAIHFDKDQIHWECRELWANEIWPNGLHTIRAIQSTKQVSEHPLQMRFLRENKTQSFWHFSMTDIPHQETETRLNAWRSIIDNYSSRRLTFPSDRLPALAGLASEFSRLGGNDEYMCGLWRSDLHRQLVWRQTRAVLESTTTSTPTMPDWTLSPSWSWVSVGSPVEWHEKMYYAGPVGFPCVREPLASMVSKDTGLPHQTLHVTGKLMKIGHNEDHWCRSGGYRTSDLLLKPQVSLSGFLAKYELDAWFLHRMRNPACGEPDVLLRSILDSTLAMPILWWNDSYIDHGAVCLVIQRVEEFSRGVYRRVGTLTFASEERTIDREMFDWGALKKQDGIEEGHYLEKDGAGEFTIGLI